ncbi:hypothetical protein M2153_002782 [Pseudomonas sp. JUb96]|nr:hypothetical protein [Pseudomonas sp. JUb96]
MLDVDADDLGLCIQFGGGLRVVAGKGCECDEIDERG